MRSRRLLVAASCVLVVAASCSGHHTKVLGTTKTKASKPVPHSRTAPTAPPGVPKVILQSGTAYQNGSLVQFCTGSNCRQGIGTQPHALDAKDPLLFLIDTVPATAQVQLVHAGSTAPADTRALHVGTMMLYAPTVRPGTYVVHLNATWQNGHGSWLFSILIPKT
jgi:hypothetical protein